MKTSTANNSSGTSLGRYQRDFNTGGDYWDVPDNFLPKGCNCEPELVAELVPLICTGRNSLFSVSCYLGNTESFYKLN